MKLYQKKIIAEYCREHEEIVASYLFGSYAVEKQNPQSDVDIAILLATGCTDFDLIDCIVSLEHLLQVSVDVVILNRAGEVLKFQVRLNGVLLYERDENVRKEFEVKSRKYYEDFLYLHENYSRKVLYGGVGGS